MEEGVTSIEVRLPMNNILNLEHGFDAACSIEGENTEEICIKAYFSSMTFLDITCTLHYLELVHDMWNDQTKDRLTYGPLHDFMIANAFWGIVVLTF